MYVLQVYDAGIHYPILHLVQLLHVLREQREDLLRGGAYQEVMYISTCIDNVQMERAHTKPRRTVCWLHRGTSMIRHRP